MITRLPPKVFHSIWFAGLAGWLIFEVWAVIDRGEGDTFSEWTWSKISQFPLRMIVGGLLVWLFYHFLWAGPNRGLHREDAIAVVVGLASGYLAFRYGWH